jgi:serine/threonine protein kinase
MGTADYMSPEQARGADVDGRADIYALGCVLFKTLTGVVPFDRGSDLEKMWAHVNDDPPSLLDARPELPKALDEAVRHAMAKDRDDRPDTAQEFAREALAAVHGEEAEPAARTPAEGAMRVVVA